MQTIKKRIAEQIVEAVKEINAEATLEFSDVAAMLEYPPDATMGDLAFPCFRLSKTLRRSPVQIAAALAEKISDIAVSKVEAVNGYLNITISNDYLSKNVIPEILAQGDHYGSQSFGEGKMVVLDYSSPNVAKPFHIGHLGTTVIGHALRRLHEFAGYDCVGINYLGDWGTQFGKLLTAYFKWGKGEQTMDSLLEEYCKKDFLNGRLFEPR